jgi:hypothetical protein
MSATIGAIRSRIPGSCSVRRRPGRTLGSTCRHGCVALCLVVAATAASLEAQGRAPELAVRVGPTISILDGLDNFQEALDGRSPTITEHRAAFSAGGELWIPVGDVLSLGGGVHWVPRGGRVDWILRQWGTSRVNRASLEVRTTHVEVPVILRLDAFGTPGVFLFGGSVLSVESSCRTRVVFDAPSFGLESSESGKCDDGELADRRKRDVGGVFGGGLTLPAGLLLLFLDARYTFGLRDIAAREDGQRVRSRAATLSAGFAVPLARRERVRVN